MKWLLLFFLFLLVEMSQAQNLPRDLPEKMVPDHDLSDEDEKYKLDVESLSPVELAQGRGSHFQAHGEMNFHFLTHQKPSGLLNTTAFVLNYMSLAFTYQPNVNDLVFVSIDGAYKRSEIDDSLQPRLETAYFQKSDFGWERTQYRLGLLNHPWIDFNKEIWPNYFVADSVAPFLESQAYLSNVDLGASFGDHRGDSSLQWQFSIVNGSGETPEDGPNKDLRAFLRAQMTEHSYLSFLISSGRYEHLNISKSDKSRYALNLAYHNPKAMSISLEYFEAFDAVDGLIPVGETLASVADGVDLLSRSGEVAKAVGGAATLSLRLGDWRNENLSGSWHLFSRWGQVNPDSKIDKNSLTQAILGFKYQAEKGLSMALVHEDIRYEKNHSPGINDKSRFYLSSQILF